MCFVNFVLLLCASTWLNVRVFLFFSSYFSLAVSQKQKIIRQDTATDKGPNKNYEHTYRVEFNY